MRRESTLPPPFRIDQWAWLLMLAIAIANAIVFSGVRSAGFIDLDDDIYVTANPHVLTGLSAPNVAWALTVGPAGLWMPLTWWSLQLDAVLSGPPPVSSIRTNPPRLDASVYHLDNLLLHIVAAAALFLFLYRATRGRWASFLVVLLWSIHPLRVESVAWVTERKDVLSGAFGFAAPLFVCRVAGARRNRTRNRRGRSPHVEPYGEAHVRDLPSAADALRLLAPRRDSECR